MSSSVINQKTTPTMVGNNGKYRKLSTRLTTGIPLTQNTKLSIVGNDYDVSMNTLSSANKASNASEHSSILPRLSIVSNVHIPVGKKVVFKLDDSAESLSKGAEKLLPSELPSNSRLVSREAVTYNLEHKNKETISAYDFFARAALEESDDGSFSDMSVTSSEIKVLKDFSVTFNGFLIPVDKPIYSKFQIPYKLKSDWLISKKASISSGSKVDAEDLWPWPWLDYKYKANDLYKSSSKTGVTFYKQSSLPSLPVPILGRSLQRFLQSMRPFISESTLKHLRKLAGEFAVCDGSLCQTLLIEASLSDKCWTRQVLPNYLRLYSRLAAPFLNQGIVCPFMYDLWPEQADTQMERATIIIECVVDFWLLVRNELLEPIHDKQGHQMCMHSFRRMFSSVRIPGNPSDGIYYFFHTIAETEGTSKHIIVIYKGFIFTMGVMDSKFVPLKRSTIKHYLEEIVRSVDNEIYDGEDSGIGILTSLERSEWSEARDALLSLNEMNAASLREIETAMFVISLDKMKIVSANKLPHEAVFGDGYNRWYDKNFTFYIYSNGLVTVNANSSLVDGPVMAMLLHYIHLRVMENVEMWDEKAVIVVSRTNITCSHSHGSNLLTNLMSQIKSRISDITSMSGSFTSSKETFHLFPSLTDFNAPRRLEFSLNQNIWERLRKAEADFSNLAASISTDVCCFDEYERQLFQDKDVNTDAFAQMVIHYTFFSMYHRLPSVGTTISLRRFYHGRFEMMRTTTNEMVAWCRAMIDRKSTNAHKRNTFWKAEMKHRSLLKEHGEGQGHENHMAALKVIAEDKLNKSLEFFQNEVVQLHVSREKFEIYTECLGIGCLSCPTVLPLSSEGYGVGYFVANTKVVFNVATWQDVTSTNAGLFAQSLRSTMLMMYDLLHCL